MAERLESISRQIHWSLLVRAVIFGLAWLFLPFWLFFLISLYMYFVPWFGAGRLFWPYFALMVLVTIETPTFFFALVFAAIFYTILLLKDLIIVDRRSAYEVIALILSLLLLRDFYTGFADGVSGWAAFTALFLAWLIVLLLKSFTSKVEAGIKEKGESESGILSEGVNSIADSRTTGIKGPIFWFVFTIIAELIIAGLFLPLDFIYQSILVFLLIILIFELVPEHLAGTLSKRKIFGTGVIIFALSIIVLLSARWGL